VVPPSVEREKKIAVGFFCDHALHAKTAVPSFRKPTDGSPAA
jgi:hypothetical protein